MVTKASVEANLRDLDLLYQKSSSTKESLFYSKLAILELCGWIEESMDGIVVRCARRHLKTPSNIKYIEKKVIQQTYGFEYEKHFRMMLIRLVGLIYVEKLERSVDPAKLARLQSTLAALKRVRDTEAHTHLIGATKRINAPSATYKQFTDVHDGLMEYDKQIRRLSFP